VAERLLTSGIACHFASGSQYAAQPVATAYGVLKAGAIGRVDCTVLGPDDIPTTRALADTRDLIEYLKDAYLRGDTNKFREETIAPRGDQSFDPYILPRGVLLGFYLRVLARTIGNDPSGNLGRQLSKDLNAFVPAALVKPDRRPAGSTGSSYMEDVVVGISELVKATPVIDVVAWVPLWGWAANVDAQLRTRIYAMQAIEKIVSRGTIPVTQAMLAQADKLRESFESRARVAPPDRIFQHSTETTKREHALATAQANSTVATAAEKLAEKGFDTSSLTPLPIPAAPIPWVPLLAVGVGSVGIIIVALLVRGRSKSTGPRPIRRLPRRRGR
jgi:hypothetical protein